MVTVKDQWAYSHYFVNPNIMQKNNKTLSEKLPLSQNLRTSEGAVSHYDLYQSQHFIARY